MKISVALAYYNGEKYIEDQIASILPQLAAEDEVVISVDAANPASRKILKSLSESDERIRVIRGPGKGVVRNFERAIRACVGDVIFLSDQDDVWADNKVERVIKEFEDPEVMAVLHDARLMDGQGTFLDEKSMFSFRRTDTGAVHNIVRNGYVGCCMAFRRKLVGIICPIPGEMYMHDFWIGMAAEMAGKVVLIKEPLLYYRRHGFNVTELRHGNLGFMLRKRIDMVRCLSVLRKRINDQAGKTPL